MTLSIPDCEITRLIQVIRSANVRDGTYLEAEQAIVRLGQAVRPVLVKLLSDPDNLVRARAAEMLTKLDTSLAEKAR